MEREFHSIAEIHRAIVRELKIDPETVTFEGEEMVETPWDD